MAGKVRIYGGSGGVGSSVARALVEGGREVHLVARDEAKARQGFTFHGSIGMAKGAVEGLTLSLAAELAPKVGVNAIAPSLTRTPLAAACWRTRRAPPPSLACIPCSGLARPRTKG